MRLSALILILNIGSLYAQGSIVYSTDDTLSTQPSAQGWVKKGNGRFNFWFDYPSVWTAENKSVNGGGFFINCHDSSIDARVYGTNRVLDDEGDLNLIANGLNSQQITFVDGAPGKMYFSDVVRYYVRIEPDVLLVFYVHAPKSVLSKNSDTFEKIGRSLRLGRLSIDRK